MTPTFKTTMTRTQRINFFIEEINKLREGFAVVPTGSEPYWTINKRGEPIATLEFTDDDFILAHNNEPLEGRLLRSLIMAWSIVKVKDALASRKARLKNESKS